MELLKIFSAAGPKHLIWRWMKQIKFGERLIWRFHTKVAKIAKFSARQYL